MDGGCKCGDCGRSFAKKSNKDTHLLRCKATSRDDPIERNPYGDMMQGDVELLFHDCTKVGLFTICYCISCETRPSKASLCVFSERFESHTLVFPETYRRPRNPTLWGTSSRSSKRRTKTNKNLGRRRNPIGDLSGQSTRNKIWRTL